MLKSDNRKGKLNETKAYGKLNETPIKRDGMRIGAKNVVTYIVGDDLQFQDSQRLGAGKAVRFKHSKAKKVTNPIKKPTKSIKSGTRSTIYGESIGDTLVSKDQQLQEDDEPKKQENVGKVKKGIKTLDTKITAKAGAKPLTVKKSIGDTLPSKTKKFKGTGKTLKDEKSDMSRKETKQTDQTAKATAKSPNTAESIEDTLLSDVQITESGETVKEGTPGKARRHVKPKKVTSKAGEKPVGKQSIADTFPAKKKQLKETKPKTIAAKAIVSPGSPKTKRELKTPSSVSSILSEKEIPVRKSTAPLILEPFEFDSSVELSVEQEFVEEEVLDFTEYMVSYEEDEELEEEITSKDLAHEKLSSSSSGSDRRLKVPLHVHARLQKGFKEKPHMEETFNFNSKIPDIDEVSIDPSILRFMHELGETMSTRATVTTIGTGSEKAAQDVKEVPEDNLTEEQKEEEEQELEAESEESYTSLSFEDFELQFIEDGKRSIQFERGQRVSQENVFESLVKLNEKPIDEFDFEEMARIAEKHLMEKEVKFFLQALIEKVMETADYVDPQDVFRQKLNKVKIFHHLAESIEDLRDELFVNEFLKKKCTDHYRMQKRFIMITPEPDEIAFDRDQKRYHDACDILRELVAKEAETEEIISRKQNAAEEELTDLQNSYESSWQEFQDLLFETFVDKEKTSEHFIRFLHKQLKDMSVLQKEISSMRAALIMQQHALATLGEKKFAMESVGPNLNIQTYETLRDDITQLVLTLDDRSCYLYKLHKRYDLNTNVLAHYRMNKLILCEMMENQLATLHRLQLEKEELRRYIHILKKKRIPIQKQIYDMNFEFGLINKPALCIDYDETCDRIYEMREVVKRLKSQVNSIQRKIDLKCAYLRVGSVTSA